MLRHALEILVKDKEMHRIEAYVHPDNIPSLTLVKKMHFIPEESCLCQKGSFQ